ncbi:MAG: tRNA (adenine(22)-N(1))-methyltransferase [Mycobacterium leprae]
MIRLTPRLAAVAELVPTGRMLADIGTDHAYLPAYLVGSGAVPGAIASDLREGPLDAARATLATEGLLDRVALRAGSGLTVLQPHEVATVTICGMGGLLVNAILAEGPLAGVERLVLQPNTDEPAVRQWLANHGWRLVDERLIEEERHFYVAMAAERGAMCLTPVEQLLGPHLIRAGGPTFKRYVQLLLKRNAAALAGASSSPAARARAAALTDEKRLLEEVLGHGHGR